MGSIIRLSSSAPPRKPSAKPVDEPVFDPNDALTAGGNWPFIQGTARARAVKIAAKGGETSGTTTTELVCNTQIFDGGSGSEYAEDPGGDCGLYNKFKWAYSSYRDAFYERNTPAGQDYEYVPRLVESTTTTPPHEINSGLYGVCIPIVPDSDAEIYAILAGGFLIADFISDSPFAYDGITDYAVNSGKLSQGVPAILSGIAVPTATTGDGSQDGDEPATGGSVVEVSGDFGGTAPWEAPSSSETGHAAYRGRFTFDMTLDLSGLPAGDDIEVIFNVGSPQDASLLAFIGILDDDGFANPQPAHAMIPDPRGDTAVGITSVIGEAGRFGVWDLDENEQTISADLDNTGDPSFTIEGPNFRYARFGEEDMALIGSTGKMVAVAYSREGDGLDYPVIVDVDTRTIVADGTYTHTQGNDGTPKQIAWQIEASGSYLIAYSSYGGLSDPAEMICVRWTPGNDTLAVVARSTFLTNGFARNIVALGGPNVVASYTSPAGVTLTNDAVGHFMVVDRLGNNGDGALYEWDPTNTNTLDKWFDLTASDPILFDMHYVNEVPTRNREFADYTSALYLTWGDGSIEQWEIATQALSVGSADAGTTFDNDYHPNRGAERGLTRYGLISQPDNAVLVVEVTAGAETIPIPPPTISVTKCVIDSGIYDIPTALFWPVYDAATASFYLARDYEEEQVRVPCGGGDETPFELGWITEQIGKLVGFTEAQFDRDDLTDPLYGATLDEVEFQNYIRDIREVFDFTVDDHDGVFHLTRIPSGPSYAPDATLTVSDLVRRPDANAGSYVHWERAEEATLPHAVEIEFYDPARLYVRGHVTAVLAGENISPARTKKFTIPFAILERDALKRAYITLHNIWAERVTYEISVRAKNVLLTVGDVVRFPLGDYAVDAKIVSARMDGDEVQNLTLQGIVQDKAISISANPSGVVIPSPIANQGSQYIDLNIPMLKAVHGSEDRNDWLSQYHTVAPTAAFVYPGGRIWRSQNGEFIEISVQTDLAFMGTLTAVPTQQSPLLGIDNTNTMTVQMLAGTLDQLVTVSQASARAGGNRAAVGKDDRWQIVYFTTPNHTGNGIVEITGIYWGQEGTEVYVDNLQQADWFILLNDKSRIKRQVLAAESIAFQDGESVSTRIYKATGLDQHPVAVESITRPLRGYPEKPYAPWKLAAEEIDGSPGKDLLVTWSRRDRVPPSGFAQELPMSETSDGSPEVPEFFVEIIDNTVSPAVLRTATVFEEEYSYQAGDNAADFSPALTVGDSLTVRVRQVARFRDLTGTFIDDAALYGHAAEETVTIS